METPLKKRPEELDKSPWSKRLQEYVWDIYPDTSPRVIFFLDEEEFNEMFPDLDFRWKYAVVGAFADRGPRHDKAVDRKVFLISWTLKKMRKTLYGLETEED